jgi:NAD(P)-dependent dehydrogenase (short-subunit alcohol dehydrogenase family)
MATSKDVGVAAALASATPIRTALSQFSLFDRVALVTGGHRGIGLETALALAEAGAVVYCLDLPVKPDRDWLKVQSYASYLPAVDGKRGRLEYVSGNVTDQPAMWSTVEDIVKKEGRIDVCVANAGILRGAECLDYPADEFRKVRAIYMHYPHCSSASQLIDINVNGVLFTAQAAGRQMKRLGIKGSIIMTASMSGSIANQVSSMFCAWDAFAQPMQYFRSSTGSLTTPVNLL